jgi:hypothetical protein
MPILLRPATRSSSRENGGQMVQYLTCKPNSEEGIPPKNGSAQIKRERELLPALRCGLWLVWDRLRGTTL